MICPLNYSTLIVRNLKIHNKCRLYFTNGKTHPDSPNSDFGFRPRFNNDSRNRVPVNQRRQPIKNVPINSRVSPFNASQPKSINDYMHQPVRPRFHPRQRFSFRPSNDGQTMNMFRPNSPLLLKRTGWNFERPDKETYYRLCRLLEFNPSEINPEFLPDFPQISIQLDDGLNFVENYLLNWWYCLVYNRDKIVKTALSRTINGLQKLNYATNGETLKVLNWKLIEELAEFALVDIKRYYFSFGSFSALLCGLRSFKLKCSQHLLDCLSSTLFISLESDLCKRDVAYFAKDISQVLFNLKELGVAKPNEISLKTVTSLCSKMFKLNENEKNGSNRLMSLFRLGDTFLAWRLNADEYSTDFWLQYYLNVENHYNRPTTKACNYTYSSMLLRTCLDVAYEFDKVEQFMQIRTTWLNEIAKVFNEYDNIKKYPNVRANFEMMKRAVDKLKAKYSNKVESMLSEDIIRKLDRF